MFEDSAGGNRDSPISVGSDGGALWFSSGVLSGVRSPGAELSLELSKSNYLLLLILGLS